MNQRQPGEETDHRALDETMALDSSSDTNSDGGFATDDAVPEKLGRYTIKETLGRGGMGSVYLAHDSQLDRDVALKVPKFESGTNPIVVNRFYREARSAANLSHPNLCPVFDVGEIDGTHYIAMAYIKGRPLSSYVSTDKHLAPRGIAAIVRRVAMAMEEAHQSGIIHRDLKPANIMIDHRKEPIVMDFGLAVPHDVGDESRLTQAGTLLGSPAYMSPEQLKGNPDAIGPASDIYSLGVVLYELLTGRLPFTGGGSTIAMIGQILTEDPPDLQSVRSEIESGLAAICHKSMSKDPDARYGSMKGFADALAQYIQSAPGDSKLGEPSKKATVTVSQIQLTEQSKLAKTLCESGQFVAAVPILKQIVANPEARGTKMLEWAQAALPSAEAQVTQQAKPKPKPAPATQPTAQQNPFADLPSAPAAATSAKAATPYRRPTPQRAKAKTGPPTAQIGAIAGVLLLLAVGGVYAFVIRGGNRTNVPSTTTTNTESSSAPAVTSTESTQMADPQKGNPKFAERLLTLLDRNNDGQLDSTELPAPIMSELMSADANRDEWLTRKELASLDPSDFPADIDQMPLPPANRPPAGPPAADGSPLPRFGDLRELDADGDGRIRLSDVNGPRRLFLQRADTNSDGVLDQNEMDILRQRESRRRPGPGRGGGLGRDERVNPPREGRPLRPGGPGGPGGPGN